MALENVWCFVDFSNVYSCAVRNFVLCVFLAELSYERILTEKLSAQTQRISHTLASHTFCCDVCDSVFFYLLNFFPRIDGDIKQVVSALPTVCTNGDNTAVDTHMSIQAVKH